MQEGKFTINANQIAFSTFGEGRPVVLIHGFLEHKGMWYKLIPEFNKGFQYICIDLPGHGESDAFEYKLLEEYAEIVETLLGHLNINEKISLIGHSMGGYISLAYLQKYPEKVRGLCLFSSSAGADNSLKKDDRLRTIKLLEKDKDSFIRKAIPNLFAKVNRHDHPELVNKAIEMAVSTSLKGAVNGTLAMRGRPDRIEEFAKSEIIKYYILGKEDAILAEKKMLEEIKKVANVEYEFLPDVGHMAWIEDPESTVNSINRFLNDL